MKREAKVTDKAGREGGLEAGGMRDLGKALQAHFDDLAAQPIPARILNLLSELETGSASADAQPSKPPGSSPPAPTREGGKSKA